MKRRDFIINSALALGGTALLAGCGKKKKLRPQKNRLLKENLIIWKYL